MAASLVAAAFLAGCGSTGSGTSAGSSASGTASATGSGSASASGNPAVCASVDTLKSDIAGLKNVNVTANGTSAVSDQLRKIQQQLAVVKNDAHGQFSGQIDALSNAVSTLGSRLTAAKDNLNASTVGAVATASGTVVTAGNSLVSAVSHTC